MHDLQRLTPRPRRKCREIPRSTAVKEVPPASSSIVPKVVDIATTSSTATSTTVPPVKTKMRLSFSDSLPSPSGSNDGDVPEESTLMTYSPATPATPPGSPTKRPIAIIVCSYPIRGGWYKKNSVYCQFRSSRLDALQIHVANEHWLCDSDKFVRLKLFGPYPVYCELCPEEYPHLFSSPLDRFEHCASEHLGFMLALCPTCCRIFKGLNKTSYHNHRRTYHPTKPHPTADMYPATEKQNSVAILWGPKVYMPYLNLLSKVESCLQQRCRLNPLEYVQSIPQLGREFVCRLLGLDPSSVDLVSEPSIPVPMPQLPLNRDGATAPLVTQDAVRKRGGGGRPVGGEKEKKKQKLSDKGESRQ